MLGIAMLSAGCREALERPFIYFPSRTLAADPSSVGLAFRDVRFPARDGVALHGWLLPGRRPTTLLVSHGNAGNIADRLTIARMLVDALGVGVFLYDYRGYGASEGVPSERGLVDDALGARAALLAQGVPSERIVYFGRSLGAAVSIDLALAHPPVALVLEAPFLSVRAMAHRAFPGAGFLFRTGWDSLSKIGGVRVPLLILHGDADEVVPYEHGRELFAAAAGPKTFVTIRGGRHYDLQPGWRDYWEAWRTFLRGAGLD